MSDFAYWVVDEDVKHNGDVGVDEREEWRGVTEALAPRLEG